MNGWDYICVSTTYLPHKTLFIRNEFEKNYLFALSFLAPPRFETESAAWRRMAYQYTIGPQCFQILNGWISDPNCIQINPLFRCWVCRTCLYLISERARSSTLGGTSVPNLVQYPDNLNLKDIYYFWFDITKSFNL